MAKTAKPKDEGKLLFTFEWVIRRSAEVPEEKVKIEIEADSEESALSLASQKVLDFQPLYHYYTNKFSITKAV